MNADEISTLLIEEAKQFYFKSDTKDKLAELAYLHATVLIAFSALEAHIYAISEELSLSPKLTLFDRSVFLEREIKYENGGFELGRTKYYRILDKVEYFIARYGNEKIDKTEQWWSSFSAAISLRNDLAHPKGKSTINREDVKALLVSIIDVLNRIYKAVYKTKLPVYAMGLDSKLDF